MKIPLHYQVSEFDCGPTTVLNAMSYLFERENLTAEIVRNIMIYCLDCYNEEGRPGGNGTSRAAMMFLSNWLNGFGKVAKLPVSSRYLSGKSVYMGQESQIPVLPSGVRERRTESKTRRKRSVKVAPINLPIILAPRRIPSATSFAETTK